MGTNGVVPPRSACIRVDDGAGYKKRMRNWRRTRRKRLRRSRKLRRPKQSARPNKMLPSQLLTSPHRLLGHQLQQALSHLQPAVLTVNRCAISGAAHKWYIKAQAKLGPMVQTSFDLTGTSCFSQVHSRAIAWYPRVLP